MTPLPNRHAISRASFFVELADKCDASEREAHKAYMEAAIIFCRIAIHRLQTRYKHCHGWKNWFDSLRTNASIEFIRSERDFILKEAPQKVNQVIRIGQPLVKAKTVYYYESPEIPAVDTIRRHVCEMERVIREGESKFGDGVNTEA